MAIGFNQGSVYKDIAQLSAEAASLSADAAAASALEAAGHSQDTSSAVAAADASAIAAAASEAAADSSAGAASGSADASAVSAALSEGFADDAAASWLAADKLYLGAKSADPTLDNQGDALVAGQWYFNSTTGTARVYAGPLWQNLVGQGLTSFEVFEITATEGQTDFPLSTSYGFYLVTVNGLEVPASGRSINGNIVTLVTPATGGDIVQITGLGSIEIDEGVLLISHGDLLDLGSDDHPQYLPISGSRAMTGELVLAGDAVADLGAVTKQSLDSVSSSLEAGKADVAGDTFTGPVILAANPTVDLGAATKQYVDAVAPAPILVQDLTGYNLQATPIEIPITAGERLQLYFDACRVTLASTVTPAIQFGTADDWITTGGYYYHTLSRWGEVSGQQNLVYTAQSAGNSPLLCSINNNHVTGNLEVSVVDAGAGLYATGWNGSSAGLGGSNVGHFNARIGGYLAPQSGIITRMRIRSTLAFTFTFGYLRVMRVPPIVT